MDGICSLVHARVGVALAHLRVFYRERLSHLRLLDHNERVHLRLLGSQRLLHLQALCGQRLGELLRRRGACALLLLQQRLHLCHRRRPSTRRGRVGFMQRALQRSNIHPKDGSVHGSHSRVARLHLRGFLGRDDQLGSCGGRRLLRGSLRSWHREKERERVASHPRSSRHVCVTVCGGVHTSAHT